MAATDADAELRRPIVALGALFFTNGLTFSSVLPRLPDIRADLELSLGGIGSALTGIAVGGLVGGITAAALVRRLGSRRTSVLGPLILAVGLPAVGLAPSLVTLASAFFVLGLFDGITDIAMNMQAAELDRRTERSIVNGFHAGWSIGTLCGAGTGALASSIGLSLTVHLACVSVVLVGVILLVRNELVAEDSPPDPVTDETPRRSSVFVTLAGLAFAIAIVEAAPGEWSTLFGVEVHDLSTGVAGLGYAAVTGGMVAGRLLGDRATDRWTGLRVLRGGLVVAAVSIVVAVGSPWPAVSIVGFFGSGLGASVLFPSLYLAAARRAGIEAGTGLAVMTTGARLGFLSSPLVVGNAADATSLAPALGATVAAAVAVGALMSRRLAG